MSDCLFCRIVNREIPSKIVYEDDYVLAFHDAEPKAPVHVLLIPKLHIDSLNDLDDSYSEIIAHLNNSIHLIADKLGIKESGYRVVVNCGSDAGQSVHHIHYHILGGRKFEDNFG